jgi:hypothetical protein
MTNVATTDHRWDGMCIPAAKVWGHLLDMRPRQVRAHLHGGGPPEGRPRLPPPSAMSLCADESRSFLGLGASSRPGRAELSLPTR